MDAPLSRYKRAIQRRIQSLPRRTRLLAFRLSHPGVEDIFFTPAQLKALHARGFTSQHGQDAYVLRRFFGDRDGPGFFVDVGGNDPITLNNTYYFEKKLGWQGLCIDPLPQAREAWASRRSARFVACAATDQPGTLEFDVVSRDHWGHAFSAIAGESDKYGDMNFQRIQVPGRRLDDIFAEQQIDHIDFLSLDVEGHELAALRSIDFERTTIDVIALENNTPTFEFGSEDIRSFLRRRNFRHVARFRLLDDIFVHEDVARRLNLPELSLPDLARRKLRWLARRLGYWLRDRRKAGPRVLRQLAQDLPDAVFVEVGANDGKMMDPLHQIIAASRWQGFALEPVPELFEKLQANYAPLAPRVRPVNAAISTRDGALPFNCLRDRPELEPLPAWAHGLGSFNRQVILDHAGRIPGIESHIEVIQVRAFTWAQFCKAHGLERVDVLMIDTEGHDLEVLEQIDLQCWRPALIIFEHHHLPAGSYRQACDRLQERGYRLFSEGLDTWCLDFSTGSAISARLRRQLPRWVARSSYARPIAAPAVAGQG